MAWLRCSLVTARHSWRIYYFCFVEKYLCIKNICNFRRFEATEMVFTSKWGGMNRDGNVHWSLVCAAALVMCDGPRWCRPRPRLTSPNNYPSPQSAPSPPAWLLLSCRGPRRSRRARRGTVASRGDAVAW